MDKEEGEMSDDNAMDVDDNIVLYKADKNGVTVKHLEKVDAEKLEDRAKRFGLNLTGNRVITQRQIDELYNNFGIESGNERHFRFDTLHLNGVDELSTTEIFEYLEDYKPISLEWIDDISCNVVCHDHISAALALLVHSREIKNEDIKSMLANESEYHWREGMPHPKKDMILMRFATNGDKKVGKKVKDHKKKMQRHKDEYINSASKNPWGDLCKSWGVYDHQEFFHNKPKYNDEYPAPESSKIRIKNQHLATRLGKKRSNNKETEDSDSDSEWTKKSKTPRMRMHADDEESRNKKHTSLETSKSDDSETYASLSIEVINSHSNYTPREHTKLSDKFKNHHKGKDSIQSRLGLKVSPTNDAEFNNKLSSHNMLNHISSKVQKVSSKSTNSTDVWSRLESKSSSSVPQSDLRQIIKSKKQKNPNDLRQLIRKINK